METPKTYNEINDLNKRYQQIIKRRKEIVRLESECLRTLRQAIKDRLGELTSMSDRHIHFKRLINPSEIAENYGLKIVGVEAVYLNDNIMGFKILASRVLAYAKLYPKEDFETLRRVLEALLEIKH